MSDISGLINEDFSGKFLLQSPPVVTYTAALS
jgi:hypothetical protein